MKQRPIPPETRARMNREAEQWADRILEEVDLILEETDSDYPF